MDIQGLYNLVVSPTNNKFVHVSITNTRLYNLLLVLLCPVMSMDRTTRTNNKLYSLVFLCSHGQTSRTNNKLYSLVFLCSHGQTSRLTTIQGILMYNKLLLVLLVCPCEHKNTRLYNLLLVLLVCPSLYMYSYAHRHTKD